jgi:hypothetical protein
MNDQVEELLRAGVWLGPALLGAVCYRMLSEGMLARSGDDVVGAAMLATAAIVLTIAGTRFNKEQHAAVGPAVFAAMFIASWFIR